VLDGQHAKALVGLAGNETVAANATLDGALVGVEVESAAVALAAILLEEGDDVFGVTRLHGASGGHEE
jgi:hypothetical protein